MKFAFGCMVAAMTLFGCSPKKSDVKEEWRDVEEERAEAINETKKYSEREKRDFEKSAEKRLTKHEDQLVELRAEVIELSGMDKANLQDVVWELEREIVEAKAELNSLKKRDVNSWDSDRQRMQERLTHIDSVINNGKLLAH